MRGRYYLSIDKTKEKMNITEAVQSLSSTDGFFRHWMPYAQRVVLTQSLRGEEKSSFVTILTELKARIESMPKSYETDGQGDEAVVYLHYFRGSVDAWVIEKDKGEEPDNGEPVPLPCECYEQYQAFGKVDLGYGAELGYISISDLINNGVELDLYFDPKPLSEIRKSD